VVIGAISYLTRRIPATQIAAARPREGAAGLRLAPGSRDAGRRTWTWRCWSLAGSDGDHSTGLTNIHLRGGCLATTFGRRDRQLGTSSSVVTSRAGSANPRTHFSEAFVLYFVPYPRVTVRRSLALRNARYHPAARTPWIFASRGGSSLEQGRPRASAQSGDFPFGGYVIGIQNEEHVEARRS
jgi:hypothetical protein